MVQLLEVQARGAPARDAERLARADTQYARDTDRDEHTVERASEAVFRFSLSGGRGFDGASALTSCLMCLTSAIVDRINRFAFGGEHLDRFAQIPLCFINFHFFEPCL